MRLSLFAKNLMPGIRNLIGGPVVGHMLQTSLSGAF